MNNNRAEKSCLLAKRRAFNPGIEEKKGDSPSAVLRSF